MVAFFIILLFIVVFIIRAQLKNQMDVLGKKLSNTEEELRIASDRISVLEDENPLNDVKEKEESYSGEQISSSPTKIIEQPSYNIPKSPSVTNVKEINTKLELKTSNKPIENIIDKVELRPTFFQKYEKKIAENWTGIVGTILMVLGVGFLGVYTALKVSEFFRFVMIVACSAGMIGGFFFLRKKEKWIKLALWMRSAGGAVFLFACLGAGGIPGLHWISNPIIGLTVLIIGVAVNLLLAVIGGKQIFASLHVLLALIALAIAPQNSTMFLIASLVSIFGIGLTFREKWDKHLLLTISSFFVYHIYWFIKMGGRDAFTRIENVTGIIIVSIVCSIAALVHYRKLYSTKEFDNIPFLVHLINWLYFGLGILMHVVGSKWKTVPLFIGAAVAFALASYAKKLKIRWLHCTDTLIAQIITIIAFMSLANWGIGYDMIVMFVFLESLIYTAVISFVKEDILFRAGITFAHLFGIGLLISFIFTGDLFNSTTCVRQSIFAGICSISTFSFCWFISRLEKGTWILYDTLLSGWTMKTIEFSITGLLGGIFLLAISVFSHETLAIHYALIGATAILIIVRPKLNINGISAATVLLIIAVHLINWVLLYYNNNSVTKEILTRGLPLFILSISAIKWDYFHLKKTHIKWFGIYLAIINFIIISYLVFKPFSPLIPGVAWLLTSVFLLEFAKLLSEKYKGATINIGEPEKYLLHGGYLLLGLFIFRHILVHLQSEEYLGFIKIRFIIEILAIAIFLYWAFTKKIKSEVSSKSWVYLHPLFAELTILFTILTISIEVQKYWHPISWLILAFGGLFLARKFPKKLSRMSVYSILLYWISIFQVTFQLGGYEKLGNYWFHKDWAIGSLAIILQFTFLYIFHKIAPLKEVIFDIPLNAMNRFTEILRKYEDFIMFYPLIICVALFLYWTFSESMLTLLWVLECFGIFVISIALKQQHFRYSALTGIILCIIRLVFFDLSRSTTLVKALVFLGVGILMLGMHALYNRFQDRLFEEKRDEVL